jgi:hypothetical protein
MKTVKLTFNQNDPWWRNRRNWTCLCGLNYNLKSKNWRLVFYDTITKRSIVEIWKNGKLISAFLRNWAPQIGNNDKRVLWSAISYNRPKNVPAIPKSKKLQYIPF